MLLLSVLLTLLVCLLVFFYIRYIFKSYWKDKDVPYLPTSIIFGNVRNIFLFKKNAGQTFQEWYHHEIGANSPVLGIQIFHKPALLIKNLDLIKQILIKDFNSFPDRYAAADFHNDPLGSNNLFFIKNPIWKSVRSSISPIFTSGKIKNLFPLLTKVGEDLDEYLCSLKLDQRDSLTNELKNICSLYGSDVIASAAYGVNANSFKNPESGFCKSGRKIFTFNTKRAYEFLALFFIPQLVSILRINTFTREAAKFLRSTIDYVIKERQLSNNVRHDLIDLLVDLKKSSKFKGGKYDEDDILAAQAAIFFTAGFETTASLMSFALYELSKRPDIQDKLRNEIKNSFSDENKDLSYEKLQDMRYLNMIVQETLRMYPPLPFLDRECSIGKNSSTYSLKPMYDLDIPHGMPVYIPIYAIQRDPKYFSSPETFDPERFSTENKDNIKPYTYIPFGLGPRSCIGERFGLIQAKVGIVYFLKNHIVRPISSNKLILNKKSLIIQPKDGINCKIIKSPLFT